MICHELTVLWNLDHDFQSDIGTLGTREQPNTLNDAFLTSNFTKTIPKLS